MSFESVFNWYRIRNDFNSINYKSIKSLFENTKLTAYYLRKLLNPICIRNNLIKVYQRLPLD